MQNPLKKIILAALLMCMAQFSIAQQDTIPAIWTYKKIDTLNLQLKIFKPAGFDASKKYPAIVFFFGGGWVGGNIGQFQKQAVYLASRGMVTILADYRVASRHHTTPFECVADGKSAIRYVRQHSAELGIDPNRIAAGGGSAGGHVAAATDLTKLDEPSEDLNVSSRPNALVLFNPVFNNGPGEYGYDRIKDRFPEISPFHNIAKGAAPTVVFLGTKDKLISVPTAEAYKAKMLEAGSRCELFLYPDQPHGFFNKGESFTQTLRQTDVFLESLGYIKGKPTI
ncbi:alpha/beta hydrolase [Dyadobacter bucti]|uniref:alpha/beta hydrolase n=1 Tax=Dyadobacter bucti TaxID=2572203 RepID=UPI001108FA85|nr:alpha/beta hydrolase [Dyadobacter bucti]